MNNKCLDDELHDIFVQGRKHIMVCLREIYEKGKAEMLDEVIKKLAENDDTILTDKQYYTLMELKEQNF